MGINTDKPEEALSVNGNIRVTGCIEHPSDMRIKTDIHPVHYRHMTEVNHEANNVTKQK